MIEEEALQLPIRDRAKLAHRLLESLDDISAADAEQLWLEEAQRRAEEIDKGQVKLVSAEELERRVQARLK
jgi:putative addiction module component (TIGR02574 family)